ncbi:hypothetical protein F3Y22_tig00001095pilonHSYRG00005 [Hibiscus syriacus]|uniref:Uncharacterized protein n=1 Tax=Hibiscus syriacus TaxID=106335 RepID=A0A6A3D385_HIBSY|nr:hypothetical protein F3Y22_tig00001095pilonHSYRG00005 [Hibiscus syriacus]
MEQLLAASPCTFSSTIVNDYSTNLVSPWTRLSRLRVLRRSTIASNLSSLQPKQRRSANYHPSIWEPSLIESLTTPFSYEIHGAKLEGLKKEARNLLKCVQYPCSTLKLIDSMQRLGASYHFGREIDEALSNVISSKPAIDDLCTTSLLFRILREHAYPISTEVEMGSLGRDTVALLSLYEASHLGMHGEDVMEEAKKFRAEHLKSSLGKLNCDLAMQVQQSLKVPLRWRMPRIEAMNFIHVYQEHDTNNSTLIELAKLDYNLVQAVYQQELKQLATWWTELRTYLTRFVCILSAIDHIWDTTSMKDLPEYMRTCYLALLDYVNDMEHEILKDDGSNNTHYIKEEASSKQILQQCSINMLKLSDIL